MIYRTAPPPEFWLEAKKNSEESSGAFVKKQLVNNICLQPADTYRMVKAFNEVFNEVEVSGGSNLFSIAKF